MSEIPEQGMRTREIEDVTNVYFIHPISRILVRYFTRWGVRPNTVSLLGMVFGAVGAVAYYHYEYPSMVVLGFLLMIGWHVLDGADGQLARLTGQTSEIGRVLDGLCDHLTFTLVYFSISLALTPEMGMWIWLLAALAGASHVVQASAYEFQRQAYDYWVHGKESARIVPLEAHYRILEEKHGLSRLFARLSLLYVKVQYRFAAYDAPLYQKLSALVDHTYAVPVREAYRSSNLQAVRRWSWLSSNYRTLALFLACLAGVPVLFFLYEIVVLNVVFAFLARMQFRKLHALNLQLSEPQFYSTIS